MNHKVMSVSDLHQDAVNLFNNVVVGTNDTSADTIIANLLASINTLEGCWSGKDAGVQIQNVIKVHNGMVGIRNALGKLAVDSSKIASNYREIQNSNGAGLEALGPLSCDDKTILGDYSDVRDTIGITEEANVAKEKIDLANNSIEGFIAEVKRYYNSIMGNWIAGTGREDAQNAFEAFLSSSDQYKELLGSVSTSISTAIKNYTF